ncbi:hypothetical protein GXP71_01810 [Cellulomonas sp. H30R-01]|jgi:hypothetical protein|uniref:Uncharacterized protein n=2 Tax=Cellulomonas TaxID=1707 RepID=A0A401UYJ6_9CELL|nr:MULTISPECIES: hypothetical protein [Cellulomonas]NKY41544.1 hypothetical protein [Cellulomonas septica]QHT54951.1 hypothetical protein GXP71_01810 [Cellulomonas sp. H30R-01]GCD19763.1 hypothetical protein CTKZ_13250 [Cellulomonas algicola]
MTVCLHVFRGDPDGKTPVPGTSTLRTATCVRCGRRRTYQQRWPGRDRVPNAAPDAFTPRT